MNDKIIVAYNMLIDLFTTVVYIIHLHNIIMITYPITMDLQTTKHRINHLFHVQSILN